MSFVYQNTQPGALHFVDPTTGETYMLTKGATVTVPVKLRNSYNRVLRLVGEVDTPPAQGETPIPDGNGLSIPSHDFIKNTYTGKNITKVEYYIGGEAGILVATIDMTYDANGNVVTVSRS